MNPIHENPIHANPILANPILANPDDYTYGCFNNIKEYTRRIDNSGMGLVDSYACTVFIRDSSNTVIAFGKSTECCQTPDGARWEAFMIALKTLNTNKRYNGQFVKKISFPP